MGMSAREFAREREALKYDGCYQTTSTETGAPPLCTRSSAADPVLTSFAQLAVFRLNANRALISLFDREYQYLVAEATPSLALQPGIPSSELWLCGGAVPRSQSICESVLMTCPGDGPLVSVVPDLTRDARYSDRHHITHWPFNRFYAGVPLCTPKGINIGVVCVFDSKPRHGLDAAEMQHLTDLSDTIMHYLESRRIKSNFSRNERMVRGLCNFVQGESVIPGNHYDAEGLHTESNEEDGICYVRRQESQPEPDQDSPAQLIKSFLSPVRSQSEVENTSTVPTNGCASVPLSTPVDAGPDATTQQPLPVTPSYVTKNTQESVHLGGIKRVFAKASTIIQEAVEADGVIFLDASVRSFGGLVGNRSRKSSQTSNYLSSSCDEEDTIDLNETGQECCDVFGFSYHGISSKDGHPPSPLHSKVPEKFLQSLLRHYPRGHVFNFDDDGKMMSGDESCDENEDSTSAKSTQRPDILQKTRRRTSFRLSPEDEMAALASIFPNTRSLLLVPLWDMSRERWSACGFVFNYSESRYFTVQADLSFLRAFGMSIQAELDRVETMFSEKAKSDMLGSLSHELRSPLHGLLGACELIHDTNMSVFQKDMIYLIETSGRTLLDVIDHLLDYSKINSVRRDLKQNGEPKTPDSHSQRHSLIERSVMTQSTDIELDLLTEEVVESIFTGYNFQSTTLAEVAGQQDASSGGSYSSGQTTVSGVADGLAHLQLGHGSIKAPPVSVYLDIDPSVSWKIVGVPGALRRIIMNLVGNALKFTAAGFVYVGLHLDSVMRGSRRRTHVVLTVIDSGKGISDDFLRNRIFKPFSQEDKLSPGTGLGLNIVHQITNTMGGYIRVHSQVGQGTQFSIFLPHPHPLELSPREEPFVSQVNALAGLRVCLFGFQRSFSGPFISNLCADERTLVAQICRDWLRMELVPDGPSRDVLPELIIVDDIALGHFLSEQAQNRPLPPVVVVCRNALIAHNLSTTMKNRERYFAVQFISQPAGVRKLAQALVYSFTRWKETQKAVSRPKSWPSDSGVSELNSTEATPWDEYPTPLSIEAMPSPLPSTTEPTEWAVPSSSTGPEAVSITEDENASSQTLQPPPEENPTSPSSDFLVVDDNKINVQILCSFLKKLKKPHKTAMDGLEAVETYTAHPGHFEYVFMDISMPRMDGLEATRRIRTFEQERQLRPATIIALTGLASSDMQKEAFASGVDLFLTKPVRLKELTKVIEKRGDCTNAATSG